MKALRILLIAGVVLGAFLVTAYAEETAMTLNECIEQAVYSSQRLEASRAKVDAASRNERMNHASRLPSLGLNGKADWVSETMKLDLDIPPNPIFTPPNIEFGDGTNFDFALAVSAPLYTGGSLRSLERSAAEEAIASRYDLAADSLTLIYEVRTAYFKALTVEEGLDIAKQAEDALQRHLEEVNGLIEQGMANREARLLNEARLKDAQRAVVNAEAGVRASRLNLGRLTGHTGEEITPVGALDASLVAMGKDAAGSVADRPDLLALKARGVSGGYRADAARGSMWPTVSAQAAMHYGKPGIDMISNEWMDYATVGVRLSWTLFDWGARDNRTQQAKAMQAAIGHGHSEAEQAWQTRYEAAIIQLEAAKKDHQLASERVDLYQERLTLLTQRYQQGLATESERLDAEDELTMAKRNRLTAEAKIRLAETDLLFILGE